MAIHRTKKNKTAPNYGFLVSWEPTEASVKGESKNAKTIQLKKVGNSKNADKLAKDSVGASTKQNLMRALVFVSLILSLELVIYLAWNSLLR